MPTDHEAELSALRARIAELEAEILRLPVDYLEATARIAGGSPWLDAIAARQLEIRARAAIPSPRSPAADAPGAGEGR